jgi:hypothetical protein
VNLFAYGSLCDPCAAAALLRRAVTLTPARAPGWERGWFVCTDNAASGSYACDRCDGLPDSCRVLGIQPRSGSSVIGALITLQEEEIPVIAERERSYRMREIAVHTADGAYVTALAAVPRSEFLCSGQSSAAIPAVYERAFHDAMRALAGNVTGGTVPVPSGGAPRRADLRYVRGDGVARERCTCAPDPAGNYFGV